MAGPLTPEEARGIAREVASRFGVFECDRCAIEIAKRIGRVFPASFERLRTSDDSDVIGLALEDIQISRNRTHVGVLVGDRVYDNLYHEGVPKEEWVGRFLSVTEAPLIHETRPVEEFFGKVFLTRKFIRWVFGS
jgi:hypothetical protein